MLSHRASGILLHPTSLPTPFGIGDFGPAAERFLDWLADAGQHYWQVLPLVPTDIGESPYQSPSAFAGNPLLISPQRLADDGLLTEAELAVAVIPDAEFAPRVDFEAAVPRKTALLEAAVRRLLTLPAAHALRVEFDGFCQREADWLEPHAMFMALREANGGRWWVEWTRFVDGHDRPTADAVDALAARLGHHRGLQFLFARQWSRLRQRAHERGVRIIGDVPIYVSHDSADVWANRQWFQLDESGRSTRVAGVPPDYFSETGQLWNNPLYDWDALHRDGYRWWIRRLEESLNTIDLIRLDHFRGFEAYWSVPAGEETAIHGEWVPGPADDFLAAIQQRFGSPNGELPIIAEDLGMITDDVHALREQFGLPGMKVLQFRLPGASWEPKFTFNEFERNSVVYTGTHDNDTVAGWFASEIATDPEKLEALREITPCDPAKIAWEFLELAWKSSSQLAIAPLQDVLGLGREARMNTPGTVGNGYANWRWKLTPAMLTEEHQWRLRELTLATGRSG
jgi:4-alpha-glucanotransferase